MKHKHYDLIVAWANGKKIEARLNGGEWHELSTPAWNGIDTEYRIKPEPHPDFVKRFYLDSLDSHPFVKCRFYETHKDTDLRGRIAAIECTFDGETTKLKSVEII
jgi:hypothetical protein